MPSLSAPCECGNAISARSRASSSSSCGIFPARPLRGAPGREQDELVRARDTLRAGGRDSHHLLCTGQHSPGTQREELGCARERGVLRYARTLEDILARIARREDTTEVFRYARGQNRPVVNHCSKGYAAYDEGANYTVSKIDRTTEKSDTLGKNICIVYIYFR